MALAEALSEPGHPSTRDQVMLKGMSSILATAVRTPHPPKRALSTSMFRWACSVPRPLFMNGQVERVHSQMMEATRTVHS